MKKAFHLLFFLFVSNGIWAQQQLIDSLEIEFRNAKNDTLKLMHAGNLADLYTEIKPDSALYYAEQELEIARALNYKLNESYALQQMGYALMNIGNLPRSLQVYLLALNIAEDPASEKNILPDKYVYGEDLYAHAKTPELKRIDKLARIYQYVGILYGNALDYGKEKSYYLQARDLAGKAGNVLLSSYCNGTLGRAYLYLKMPDSALLTIGKAYDESNQTGYRKYQGSILLNFARIHAAMKRPELAFDYFRKALTASKQYGYLRGEIAANIALAEIYNHNGLLDSSFYFIQQGLKGATELNAPLLLQRTYIALAEYYKSRHISDSVVKYQDLIIKIKSELFDAKQAQLFQSIDFDEQQRAYQKEAENIAFINRIKMYALLAGIAVLMVIAIITWRNDQNRKKAYALLKAQKQETDIQRLKAEQTLAELKSTQAQLIQSEKMASLGELTAGIAHEIENPLNFVNNFSEVNAELIDEMDVEINAGNMEGIRSIALNIRENNEKITSHGQRADSIVRGMLQHSRAGSGQKEPTDLNALCEEWLRLSYHGLRAKDKLFNSELITDYDPSIGKVNIIPQAMGRVLLNLFNNAFYSVREKARSGLENYQPIVTVSTRKRGDMVEIKVIDNGNGIPDKIKDKVFQPFFTTKPAGQGTGLGLSISYDIIKSHLGEIEAETHEGRGAEFTIKLPLT